MDRYEDLLLIFGGSGAYSRTAKMRVCNKELHIFNLTSHRWMKNITFKEETKYAPTPRMYHASAIFDHYLFIHGGINTNNKRSYSVSNLEGEPIKNAKIADPLFRFQK